MDYLQQLRHRLRQFLFGIVIAENAVLIGLLWAGLHYFPHVSIAVAAGAVLAAIILSLGIMVLIAGRIMQPLQALWQIILHLSPAETSVAAPHIDRLTFGRDLVSNLAAQIYQYADVATRTAAVARSAASDISHNFIAQNLPLPLFILDDSETITFANNAAVQYIGMPAADLVGKNVYMILDMSFPSNDTFDAWLKKVKLKNATAVNAWERVRLNVRDNHPALLFDLAAYYNHDNPDHTATMLALFDHTKMYSQDDQAVSFIALSVHELRTPLTLLRGYIEVFEDELDTSSNPEMKDFMEKMRSQAEQLMAFVNNILNVARVDDDQLQLKLEQEDWPSVLKRAVEDLGLRAKVRGITLHCRIQTDLPPVGVDRISILEVINNLVDNAIKYSGTSKVIQIDSRLTDEGMIETTVQDFGLGISSSILPNLFTKFYRDHRNRAQIGGTGLGLYLSKAIVAAHGGTIWVRSKEGQGSTFGFTLLPYARVADELKDTGGQEITHSAHGWIKNHSLYRR